MLSQARQHLAIGVVLVAIFIAGLSAWQIASFTVLNSHPDEEFHVDAYCYYQEHWLPPAYNSSGLRYSASGWSRVYDREMVYVVYGKIRALARAVSGQILAGGVTEEPNLGTLETPRTLGAFRVFLPFVGVLRLVDPNCLTTDFRTYRYLNVALYLVTVASIFLFGRSSYWLLTLGVTFLAIPQIIYTYSYANTSAWGLSISAFLLLWTARRVNRTKLSMRDMALTAIGMGIISGMILLAKKPFWIIIPFSYLYLAAHVLFSPLRQFNLNRRHIVVLSFTLISSLLIASIVYGLYPSAQNSADVDEAMMREIRSEKGWKPSNPAADGYMLASRGEDPSVIWADPAWWKSSLRSLYAMFAIMAIPVPNWMYIVAAAILLSGLLITLINLVKQWTVIGMNYKIPILSAPVFIFVNILASIYYSWAIDHQAQGRYLLPSLFPMALIWAGLVEYESNGMRTFRNFLLVILTVMGLYAIRSYAVGSPLFIAP